MKNNHDENLFQKQPSQVVQLLPTQAQEMTQSYDDILKKIRIFLTAFKSHLEYNGAMIRVADLPDNWEAPCPYPDSIDEAIFK